MPGHTGRAYGVFVNVSRDTSLFSSIMVISPMSVTLEPCCTEAIQREYSIEELSAIAAALIDSMRIARIVDMTDGASPMAAAFAVLAAKTQIEMTQRMPPPGVSVDLIITADVNQTIDVLLHYWKNTLSPTGGLLVDIGRKTLPSWSPLDKSSPIRQSLGCRFVLVLRGKSLVSHQQICQCAQLSVFAATQDVDFQPVLGPSIDVKQFLPAPQDPAQRERLPNAALIEQWYDTNRAASTLYMLKNNLNDERKSRMALEAQLRFEQEKNQLLLRSHSWKITAPLRVIARLLAFATGALRNRRVVASSALRVLRNRGLIGGSKHLLGHLIRFQSIQTSSLIQQWRPAPVYNLPLPPSALHSQRLRVLIVAEISLPQCNKYRVLQKQQLILDLGYECSIVQWADTLSTRDLLQTHNLAIFYRVPGYPEQIETILQAKSLGVKTYWEVDDLIFDSAHYFKQCNVYSLPARTRKAVLNGVPLYRKAMLACGDCIASTQTLAQHMVKAGANSAVVIENCLDVQTLSIAAEIASMPVRPDLLVRIVYGSGTSTHDSDFAVAAPAILAMLQRYEHVVFTVIGHLNLPDAFNAWSERVERISLRDYPTYMRRLATCQISIAPLIDSTFNDSKSNIKFLEAAILGLPTVCSPAAAFKGVVQHGVNGFLAVTIEEWCAALQALIESAPLRRSIGQNAQQYVQQHYMPEHIRDRQLLPIIQSNLQFSPQRKRVLGVNIYLEPRSFGGATIVIEEIARTLNHGADFEYALFTTLPCTEVHPYKLIRYQSSVGEVFAIGLPHETDPVLGYDNPYPTDAFRAVLRAWRPDIVHLHSIQGIGVQIADVCQQEGIPYVITLHDVWWICFRHFMINDRGRYCQQKTIDLTVCLNCAPHRQLVYFRQYRLRQVLQDAALLLAPSAFTRDQYLHNGISPDKIFVNQNGIRFPARPMKRTKPSSRQLSFGFVCGEETVKGADLVKKAFARLQHTHYVLKVVDHHLNLNQRSVFAKGWQIAGKLQIVPAYTQETMDDFYQQIDVLLFPSQCKESFGLAVREALVRDVWVISTDAGGVSEAIVDQKNGNLIAFDDDGTALSACIAQLLNDPRRLDDYENPFKSAIRSFSDQADELRGYLSSVLQQTQPLVVS